MGLVLSRIGTAYEGWGEIYCLWRGHTAFFRGDNQVFGSRVEYADKVEVMFRGSKWGKGRKGAVLVRTVDPERREWGAINLLVLLTRYSGT